MTVTMKPIELMASFIVSVIWSFVGSSCDCLRIQLGKLHAIKLPSCVNLRDHSEKEKSRAVCSMHFWYKSFFHEVEKNLHPLKKQTG